jgi:hypothetical protein
MATIVEALDPGLLSYAEVPPIAFLQAMGDLKGTSSRPAFINAVVRKALEDDGLVSWLAPIAPATNASEVSP